jgi:hypothetical protein
MSNFVATCFDLTIVAAGTATRWVDSTLETADAVRIGLTAPGTLDVGTYTLQISFDGTTSAGTINDGTNDVALPAAGKHCQYDPFVAPFWRISGPAAAADRTFKLTKQCNPY